MGKNDGTEIVHEEGYKDEYKVTVYQDDEAWSPTNRELFELVDKIFQSEEHEYGDGYGNRLLWFYLSMIMMGDEEKAYEAYGLRGMDALCHFEKTVEENADRLIDEIEQLREEVS